MKRHALAQVPGVEFVESMQAPGGSGSWGEALAVRDRMQAEGLRTVMVVSDPPHMLRLSYTWGSILRGTGLDYTLVATNPPWWRCWSLVACWRRPRSSCPWCSGCSGPAR